VIRVEVTSEPDVTRMVVAFTLLPVLLTEDYEIFLTGGFGPGGNAAMLRAWRRDGERGATNPTDWDASDLPPMTVQEAVAAADVRPVRLSADLTMADGRTVHVPVVEAAGPASKGKIKVEIPWPASAMPGRVTGWSITNEDRSMTARNVVHPSAHMQAGDTLNVEFGEESLDAGDIARVFGEWP
jgi:hypothetical protein